MGVLWTLSHCPPHPPARLTHHVSTQCSEQIPGKVVRQHIVFVCIKICAIKWTIKCPFVIFIGLQCCKMLKAFIFSFAMTKAQLSMAKMLTRIFYSFLILLTHIQCNFVMLWQSHQEGNELNVGWLWFVLTTGGRPADHPNYIITKSSRNKHDIINPCMDYTIAMI